MKYSGYVCTRLLPVLTSIKYVHVLNPLCYSIDDLLRDTDSDMDEGDDDQVNKLSKKHRKTKQGKGAWLMETGEDEIVDFMDPAAAKQVIGNIFFLLNILSLFNFLYLLLCYNK